MIEFERLVWAVEMADGKDAAAAYVAAFDRQIAVARRLTDVQLDRLVFVWNNLLPEERHARQRGCRRRHDWVRTRHGDRCRRCLSWKR